MKPVFLLAILALTSFAVYPQTADKLNIQLKYDIPAECSGITMTMKHDQQGLPFLYVASKDAGGLHIINVADKTNPVEIGRYSNPAMNGRPRAYNNIVVDEGLAYVAVDYVGLEVLNVSRPSNIALVSWWNPWNPKLDGLNWFRSDGHANEIEYDKKNKLLFIAAGKTDLVVLNVARASAPELYSSYGGPDNQLGTWGVSSYGNNIYLSYVCAIIPFFSKSTGVKILTYERK